MNLDRFVLQVVAAAGVALAASGVRAQEPSPPEPTGTEEPPSTSSSAHGSDQPGAATLSGQELEDRRVTSVAGVASAVAGIDLTPSLDSTNTPILYMRGVGLANPSQITLDRAVGVYEDGFPIARSQALTFDVPGLESVEVLRGPQGALYGRDTIGGVINLISEGPAGELRFRQTADLGNRNLFRVSSSIDSPSWHGLSVKATVLASSIDGYVKNSYPGSENYGEERQLGGRLQLRWEPFRGLRADYFLEKSNLDSTALYDTNPSLNGQYVDTDFDYPYYANPNGPTTATYRPIYLPLSDSTHVAHGLTLTWRPTEAFAIKSLTGYRTLNEATRQDYGDFLDLPESTQDYYHHHQFSEELQADASLFDGQFDLLGGLSYFRERGSRDHGIFAYTYEESEDIQVTAQDWSAAAYLQLRWKPAFLGRRLEVTAAGRYTRDDKDADRVITSTQSSSADYGTNHLRYDRVSPELILSYRWTHDLRTYAKASSGYVAGGALESAAPGQFATSAFKPESLLSYELGSSLDLFGGGLHANVAAFVSRYRNIEFPLSVSLPEDQPYSIQQASIEGADLDLAAAPIENLKLTAGFELLHWTIDQVYALAGTVFDPATGAGSPFAVGQSIKNLFSLPYAPKYNFVAGADYQFLQLERTALSAHLDYSYRDTMFSNAGSGLAVPGHQYDATPAVGLLNARLTLNQETDWSHHVKVSLWGRNILNRRYYALAGGYVSSTYGGGLSSFTTDTPVGYSARAGAWAEPATYGVSASYQY